MPIVCCYVNVRSAKLEKICRPHNRRPAFYTQSHQSWLNSWQIQTTSTTNNNNCSQNAYYTRVESLSIKASSRFRERTEPIRKMDLMNGTHSKNEPNGSWLQTDIIAEEFFALLKNLNYENLQSVVVVLENSEEVKKDYVHIEI
uniref:Uncharacterized protein n=1 Tax=Glossina austeni TaxID=7395 RepID=A0A1A9VNK4_GLOAU